MATPDFQEIVDSYYEKLYRFALGLARNEGDAADLTQQTFFIWAKKGHQLREAAKVKSWLFTTLHREFLKGIRRRGRVRYQELEDFHEETPAVEHGGDKKVDHARIIEVIHDLDESYRVPLMLFYTQEFSYKEIAKALDIPIGTVMTRLSRGRDRVRSALVDKPARGAAGKIVDFKKLKGRSAEHG